MITAGIDAGSRTLKIVLWDAAREGGERIVGRAVRDQTARQDALVREVFEELREERKVRREEVGRIVATGYGRNLVDLAQSTVTEITCHAVGVRALVPEAQSVIEIGGQDSKVLRLDLGGTVRDFAMNDRCAAGTGRFLEVVAGRVGASLGELGELAARAAEPAVISSTCVVFAESEIIGLLAGGVAREDIVAGVQASLALRVAGMAGPNLAEPIVFTGGVALVPGMRAALEAALGKLIGVSPMAQFTGALGAAILAGRP